MGRKGGSDGMAGCWRGKGDDSPFVPGLPEVVPRSRTLPALFSEMVCCTRCELAEERTQVVVGSGAPDARVLFVGEAPGADEDRRGEPFVGRSGRMLDRLLEENGLDRGDVFITNIVACRPPKNRSPRVREVTAHAAWLEEQLRLVDPELVVTLGRTALIYFQPGAKITQIQGQPFEIERGRRRIRVLPLLHPAAALRRRQLLPDLEAGFARIPELLAPGAG